MGFGSGYHSLSWGPTSTAQIKQMAQFLYLCSAGEALRPHLQVTPRSSVCFENCQVLLFPCKVLLRLWALSPGGGQGRGCPGAFGAVPGLALLS